MSKNYYLITITENFIDGHGEVEPGEVVKEVRSYNELEDPWLDLVAGEVYISTSQDELTDEQAEDEDYVQPKYRIATEDDFPSCEDGYSSSVKDYVFKRIMKREAKIYKTIIKAYNLL